MWFYEHPNERQFWLLMFLKIHGPSEKYTAKYKKVYGPRIEYRISLRLKNRFLRGPFISNMTVYFTCDLIYCFFCLQKMTGKIGDVTMIHKKWDGLFDSVTFVKIEKMNFEKKQKIKNPDFEEKNSKWKILANEIRIFLWKCYHMIVAYALFAIRLRDILQKYL